MAPRQVRLFSHEWTSMLCGSSAEVGEESHELPRTDLASVPGNVMALDQGSSEQRWPEAPENLEPRMAKHHSSRCLETDADLAHADLTHKRAQQVKHPLIPVPVVHSITLYVHCFQLPV